MKTDQIKSSNLTPRIPTKRKAHHLLNHLKLHHPLQDPSIDIKPFDNELNVARPGTPTIILDRVSQPLSDGEDPLILKDSPSKQANRHLRRQSRALSNLETYHHNLPLINTLESNRNQYSLPSASISTATVASPAPEQLNTPTAFSSENISRPERNVKDLTASKSPLPRSPGTRDNASISEYLKQVTSPYLSGKNSQHMSRVFVNSRQERNSCEGSLARNSRDSSATTRQPSAVSIPEPPSHIQLDDQSSDVESDTQTRWTNPQNGQQNHARFSSPPPTPSSRGPSRSSSVHVTIISQPRGSSSSQFLEIVKENIVVDSSSASSIASSDTCRPTSRRKANQSASSASIRSSMTPLNDKPPQRSAQINSGSSREVLTSNSTNKPTDHFLDRHSNQKTTLPLRSPTISNQSAPFNRIIQLNQGSTTSSPNTSFQSLRHTKRLGTPPKPREWDKHNAFQEFEVENSDVEVTITCADDDLDGLRKRKRSKSRLTMGHVEMVLQNWPPEENVVLQSTPRGLVKIHRDSELPFTPIAPRPSMRASPLLEDDASFEDEDENSVLDNKAAAQEHRHPHHTKTRGEEAASPSEDDHGEPDDRDLQQEDTASPHDSHGDNQSPHNAISGQEDDFVDDPSNDSSMSVDDAHGKSSNSLAHHERQTHQELAKSEMANSSQDDDEDETPKSSTDDPSPNNSDGQVSSDRVTRSVAMDDVSAMYESDSGRSRQPDPDQEEISEGSIGSNSRSEPDQMSDSNQATTSNPDLLSHPNQETTPESDQRSTPRQETSDVDPAAEEDADCPAPATTSGNLEVRHMINARDTTPIHGLSSSPADRAPPSKSRTPSTQSDISKRSVRLPLSHTDPANQISAMITPPMEQSARLGAPAASSRGSEGIHPPSEPIFDTRSQSSSCGRFSSDRTSSNVRLKNDQSQQKEQFQSVAQQSENKRPPLLATKPSKSSLRDASPALINIINTDHDRASCNDSVIEDNVMDDRLDDMIDHSANGVNPTRRSLVTSTPYGNRLQRPSPFFSPAPSDPSRVLQISSFDPKTAAQAAAILKVYHGFKPCGFKIEDNEATNPYQLEHQMEESILKEEARAEKSLFYQQMERNKILSVVDEDEDEDDEDEDEDGAESDEDRNDDMVSKMLSPRPNKALNRIEGEEGRRKQKESSVVSQQPVPQSSSSKLISRIKSSSSTTTNYSSPRTLGYKPDFNHWTKTDWQILESCLRKTQRTSNSSANPVVHPTTVVLKLLKVLHLDRNQCEKEWEWSCLVRRVKALQKKSELNDHQHQREISLGIGSSNSNRIGIKGKRSLFQELNDLSKS